MASGMAGVRDPAPPDPCALTGAGFVLSFNDKNAAQLLGRGTVHSPEHKGFAIMLIERSLRWSTVLTAFT
jgi:hypothetical protein